jgi:hypothetical protein
MDSRRGRQTPDASDEAERDELVDPYNSLWSEPKYFALYRCGWVEAGEIKYSLQTSLVRADKAMRARLSEGLPAWLEQVPFTDDDVPF